MEKDAKGFWHLRISDVKLGEQYRYRLGDGPGHADPASFYQPQGVHGPSQVWDHGSFHWSDSAWMGLALEECVLYELHPGTFTPEGTLEAVATKLAYLKELGVNALEIMPVNQFPGKRGWGYDGAYIYAVQNSYGGPDSLKKLVDACHREGLAVILDVVYNHLGPEGNYLAEFGPYFTTKYATPWGQALNFDGADSDPVRDFFIENALYWFQEFHLDGLRLDAVHQIYDTSAMPFLAEMAERVKCFSLRAGRERYLIAESDLNDTRLLRSRQAGGYGMHAQWLDDYHHCLETMLNQGKSPYARDYGDPSQFLKACREGYVYSGQYCPTRRKRFGNTSADRLGREFMVFIQNHDQVGNRLTGDRLITLVDFESAKLAAGAVVLSPYIPLLFMGEEYGETNPFLFFADYEDQDLVDAVREGRRKEFGFLEESREMPDPVAEETFRRSSLDWSKPDRGRNRVHLDFYRTLLSLRRRIPALRYADKENLEVNGFDRVFSFRRWRPDPGGKPTEMTFCLLNFNLKSARARVQPVGEWELLLDSADRRWEGPGSRAPSQASAGREIELQPMSFVLYRMRGA